MTETVAKDPLALKINVDYDPQVQIFVSRFYQQVRTHLTSGKTITSDILHAMMTAFKKENPRAEIHADSVWLMAASLNDNSTTIDLAQPTAILLQKEIAETENPQIKYRLQRSLGMIRSLKNP